MNDTTTTAPWAEPGMTVGIACRTGGWNTTYSRANVEAVTPKTATIRWNGGRQTVTVRWDAARGVYANAQRGITAHPVDAPEVADHLRADDIGNGSYDVDRAVRAVREQGGHRDTAKVQAAIAAMDKLRALLLADTEG